MYVIIYGLRFRPTITMDLYEKIKFRILVCNLSGYGICTDIFMDDLQFFDY
jgi:hypothetical protein